MRDGVGVVALTGASGFLGKALLSALLQNGYRVRALQHSTPLLPHENLHIVSGTIDNHKSCTDLLEGADTVIHAAGLVAAKHRSDFQRINTDATIKLAELAQEQQVNRFLFISSLAARAPHLSAYAKSKHDAEQALKRMPKLAWDIVRPPAIYGAGDKNSLPLLKMMLRGHVYVSADKNALVSLIYIEDMVRAILTWVTMTTPPSSQTYEVADHNGGYRWQTLIEHASAAIESSITLHFIPARLAFPLASLIEYLERLWGKTPFITRDKLAELAYPDWSVNHSAFSAKTGWNPQVSLEEGFTHTLQWAKITQT